MTYLLGWLIINAAPVAAVAATFAAVGVLCTVVLQVKLYRQRTRITPELIAHMEDKGDGVRLLRLSPANNHQHRFQYHSIRRTSWFWWARWPCMSHADNNIVPSRWKRKLHFRPPAGNIGINHKNILVSRAMPQPVILIVKYARIDDNSRIRAHKLRVH